MSLEGTGLNERSHTQKMTTRPGATVADTMYTAGLSNVIRHHSGSHGCHLKCCVPHPPPTGLQMIEDLIPALSAEF